MMEIILWGIVMMSLITTIALCRALGQADKTLEHPGRITLKGHR